MSFRFKAMEVSDVNSPVLLRWLLTLLCLLVNVSDRVKECTSFSVWNAKISRSMLQRSLWHENKINWLFSKPLPGTSKIQSHVSNHNHVPAGLSSFQQRLIFRSSLLTEAANQTADTQRVWWRSLNFFLSWKKNKEPKRSQIWIINNFLFNVTLWSQDKSDQTNLDWIRQASTQNIVPPRPKKNKSVSVAGWSLWFAWPPSTTHQCVSLLKQTYFSCCVRQNLFDNHF